MQSKLFFYVLIIVAALLAVPGVKHAGAIPAQIGISGTLEDENGNPLVYRDENGEVIHPPIAAHVQFFESETSETVKDDVRTSTTSYEGTFHIGVTLSDELLALDELWYSLAIDADRNGLDENDQFEGRFRIVSVPFALSIKPVTFFSTHAINSKGTGSTMPNVDPFGSPTNVMVVAPFTTPPGGIKFNRMNVHINILEANTKISFGIYDKEGHLVASSGRVSTNVQVREAYLEVEDVEKTLLPSSLYFTAVTANPKANLGLRLCTVPGVPLVGAVSISANEGLLPDTFNPGTINQRLECTPISIALSFDEQPIQSAAIKMRSGPKVRWIPAK